MKEGKEKEKAAWTTANSTLRIAILTVVLGIVASLTLYEIIDRRSRIIAGRIPLIRGAFATQSKLGP